VGYVLAFPSVGPAIAVGIFTLFVHLPTGTLAFHPVWMLTPGLLKFVFPFVWAWAFGVWHQAFLPLWVQEMTGQ
jgi:hypothetical protein